MSSLFVRGGDTERAAEYRRRAERALVRSAASLDVRTRVSFLDIANNYLALAEHVEQRLARARTQGRSAAQGRRMKPERKRASPHAGLAT
jgi:hypothetical protein